MGLRTLDGFRDQLNLALGDKAQGNERLDRWINDALEELFIILDIEGRRVRDTFPTVAGQEAYTFPTTLVALLGLKDVTNDKALTFIAPENFERLRVSNGTPRQYTRIDRQVLLHPVPNTVLTLRRLYIKGPTPLVTGSAVTELISAFDRPLHLLALRNALMDLNQGERATFIFQAATNLIRQIPNEDWLERGALHGGIEVATSIGELRVAPS